MQLRHAGLALVFCAAASYLEVEIKKLNPCEVFYGVYNSSPFQHFSSNMGKNYWLFRDRWALLGAVCRNGLPFKTRVEALNLKTDEELAKMNLRRENITAYVFRDLMHI